MAHNGHAPEQGPKNTEVTHDLLRIAVESMDRELAFYRSRSGQIYLVALSAEALIIVGREQLRLEGATLWLAPLALTLAFAAVAVVGSVLGAEYRRRIHQLKDTRATLFIRAVGHDVHPDPSKRRVSEIQVLYFVLWFSSGGGAIISWLRAYPRHPVLGAFAIAYGLALLLAATYGIWVSFFRRRPNTRLHPTGGGVS